MSNKFSSTCHWPKYNYSEHIETAARIRTYTTLIRPFTYGASPKYFSSVMLVYVFGHVGLYSGGCSGAGSCTSRPENIASPEDQHRAGFVGRNYSRCLCLASHVFTEPGVINSGWSYYQFHFALGGSWSVHNTNWSCWGIASFARVLCIPKLPTSAYEGSC
jgi:hypothetical protein